MNVKPFIPLKYWWQGGEVPATVNCTDLQIHAHKAICRIAFNWISRVTLKCYQLSLCTKRCFVYLRVHRHFHSTVHTSTALCTCWGTCWALDPDSCCTCPPFWAEPVAWTSTLCLDTRHGFITLGARAPRVVHVHALSASHTNAALVATLTIGWMTIGCGVSIIGCTGAQQPIETCCRR